MKTKTLSIDLSSAIIFVALLSIASILPLFHNQIITGPLVNAVLFLAVILAGTQNAILIGLIPSIIAISTGLLPSALSPTVPFIMIANTLLVLSFSYFKDKNYWLGVVLSSFLKFFFLFATSSIVINLLVKKELSSKVASMLSLPQLITALAGGFLAFIFLKTLKK